MSRDARRRQPGAVESVVSYDLRSATSSYGADAAARAAAPVLRPAALAARSGLPVHAPAYNSVISDTHALSMAAPPAQVAAATQHVTLYRDIKTDGMPLLDSAGPASMNGGDEKRGAANMRALGYFLLFAAVATGVVLGIVGLARLPYACPLLVEHTPLLPTGTGACPVGTFGGFSATTCCDIDKSGHCEADGRDTFIHTEKVCLRVPSPFVLTDPLLVFAPNITFVIT